MEVGREGGRGGWKGVGREGGIVGGGREGGRGGWKGVGREGGMDGSG